MTCPFFREHFIALGAQSNFISLYFFLKNLKNTLLFLVFYLFNFVSILPQPLIAYGEFSSGSQLLKLFWTSFILIDISFELFLLKKIEKIRANFGHFLSFF